MKVVTSILALFVAGFMCTVSAQEKKINRIPDVGKDHNQQQYSTYESGFWMAAEVIGGVSTHLSGHNMGMTEVDVTAGYRLNQFLRIGAGIGGRYYIDQQTLRRHNSARGMPLFIAARGNMIPSEYRYTAPYWGLEIGGSIRDGFMWRPTVGVRIGEPRQAFTLGLTYIGQDIATHDSKDSKGTKYTSFVCLRLGYEF